MILATQCGKSTREEPCKSTKIDNCVKRINRLRFRHQWCEAASATNYRAGYTAALSDVSKLLEHSRLRPDFHRILREIGGAE